MYTPARKCSARFFAFFAVVRRWAGAPRSQFFMRFANWNAPHTSITGITV
jgi:hypothetical protein